MLKLAIVLSLSLALPGLATSQGRSFSIGVEEISYLPYYGLPENRDSRQYSGYAREVLDLFAKQMGYSFSYEPRPIKRLYLEFMERGELDFKFPDSPDWKASTRRGVSIHYSDPVAEYIDGLMVLPQNKGKRGVDRLERIGTVSGFTPWSYLELIREGKIRVAENPSTIGVLKQVLKRRIDGAYINVAVAKHQLRTVLSSEDALVFDPSLPHIESAYLLSSIKHPQIIAEFNEFLRTRRNAIDALKGKYRIDAIEME